MARPPEPEFGARVLPGELERPARFRYADPPYPGRAHLYPEGQEVDHGWLVRHLVESAPDGWALSTAADSLREVLPLCPEGVLVCSWHRQFRPYLERPPAWEPLIVCGGRRQPGLVVPTAITAHVGAGWELPGRKPPRFYRWLFDLLGAEPRDVFEELYPGSGTGADTWSTWCSERAA